MKKLIDITIKNRRILNTYLENMSKDRLLCIPEGHRNNIWWNIAHVVVTQQVLLYRLSGLPLKIPDDLVVKFKNGTIPDGTTSSQEIEKIKTLLFSTIDRTLKDYEDGLFKNYRGYTTSVDISLNTPEEAMAFNVYHEGVHLGVIRSLQKLMS